MLRVVVDTNLWVRSLLGGPVTLPILVAWEADQLEVVTSVPLIAELENVCNRPRLRKRLAASDLADLLALLQGKAIQVEVVTAPPRCRDPKDQPVLATAIDDRVQAIITGDSDLRADDALRAAMAGFGIELWGVDSLLQHLDSSRESDS